MKNAFTLAEVLITLGIIGVVAAMTLPALIQRNNNIIAETRLKKFYTTMNQAILMSVKDNGDFLYWDYWRNDMYDDDGNTINRSEDSKNSFEKYLAPYLKISEIKEVRNNYNGEKEYLYFLGDGSAFKFARHENRDLLFYPDKAEKCYARALAGERTGGICSFSFSFYPYTSNDAWKYHYKKGYEPHMYIWDGNEQTLYTNSARGCNNGSGGYCAAIIQRNGWRIPKDYPVKISY